MKILQIIQKPQLRGAEIFAAQLSQELENTGNEVILLSLFEGDALLPFTGKTLCLEADPSKRFWDWNTWRKLAQLIENFQPDIVQANAGDTLKYAALSKLFFRWKAKLIFRNANLISGFVTSKSKQMFNQFLLKQVAGIASVSSLCAKDFSKTFPIEEAKIKVLPIGVLKITQEKLFPQDLAHRLENSDFLIHIAGFVPEKNHKGLFQIFEQVQKQFPNLKLLVIGEGPLKNNFEKIYARHPEIIFAGKRTDVDAILPAAKALLLPSLIEGLPGVILEAMNHKIPVISYNVGGISEVVISKQTGWLIPVNEQELFVKQVIKVLILDEQSRSEILNNAKKMILERYQLNVLCIHFTDFYKDIINSSEPS